MLKLRKYKLSSNNLTCLKKTSPVAIISAIVTSYSKYSCTYSKYTIVIIYKYLAKPGSVISYGRGPKICMGRVFNFKLGSFVSKQHNCMERTQPLLKLKARPRFGPVSSSLSNL